MFMTVENLIMHTICPRSIDPFYIVTNYIKWVKTSWTDKKKRAIQYLF